MQLIRGSYTTIHNHIERSVVTIGNYDGIHLGHQQLLQTVITEAHKIHGRAVVVTFEPQPKEFFSQQTTIPRLMRFMEKYQALRQFAIDDVVCLRFNQALANLSPVEFVDYILVKILGAAKIVVGDDFRFGANRQGNVSLLTSLGQSRHFSVLTIPPVKMNDVRVSSTLIRQCLQQGQLELAQQYLGRPYTLSGKVAYGDQLGRRLGYPTANVHLHRKLVPLEGVFVVQVRGVAKHALTGVASIGTRPTVVQGLQMLLEVHLFDFDEDIYGCNIQVEFLAKLRDQETYDSLDELATAIGQDVVAAKHFFLKHPN